MARFVLYYFVAVASMALAVRGRAFWMVLFGLDKATQTRLRPRVYR